MPGFSTLTHPVGRFTQALVRAPGFSVTAGLRSVDRGAPDYSALNREHTGYVKALRAAGVEVQMLPALEDFPDAVFIEDPALVFDNGAVLLRPGAPTRLGEAAELEASLRDRFDSVFSLTGPGFVEGGDILVTAEQVLIGLSQRTNRAGAQALEPLLRRLGRQMQIVQTPPGVLHLKSDCAMLDDETVLTTRRLAASGVFSDLQPVLVPDGEEAAANALRINDVVFVSRGFPKTIERLDGLGYSLVLLDTTQTSKLDGGLSCLSLRW